MPPEFLRYRHSGIPKTITVSGQLQARGSESGTLLIEDSQPEELSEDEFNLLQEAVADNPRAFDLSAPRLQGQATPWLTDHGIAGYIAELRRIRDQT